MCGLLLCLRASAPVSAGAAHERHTHPARPPSDPPPQQVQVFKPVPWCCPLHFYLALPVPVASSPSLSPISFLFRSQVPSSPPPKPNPPSLHLSISLSPSLSLSLFLFLALARSLLSPLLALPPSLAPSVHVSLMSLPFVPPFAPSAPLTPFAS